MLVNIRNNGSDDGGDDDNTGGNIYICPDFYAVAQLFTRIVNK